MAKKGTGREAESRWFSHRKGSFHLQELVLAGEIDLAFRSMTLDNWSFLGAFAVEGSFEVVRSSGI